MSDDLNQTDEQQSVFATLSAIDVSEFVKKKDGFNYLPWSDAWNILKANYPLSEKEQTKFLYADGTEQPYMKTDTGYYVEVSVTVEGETMTEIYAVMEPERGKGYVAITEPDAVQINKASKRALVKAIATHGLGLYLYQGEDLPVEPKPENEDLPKAEQPKEVMLSDNQRKRIKDALIFKGKIITDTVKGYLMETRGTDDLLELLEQEPPDITKVLAERILKQWEEPE